MTDHRIPTIVVGTLAVVVVAGLGIMGYLAFFEVPIPDQIDRLTFGALTAMGAILATTRGSDATPVTVENSPSDPVPVEPAD